MNSETYKVPEGNTAPYEPQTTYYTSPQIPHKCPICNGRGVVPSGFYSGTDYIDEYGNLLWTSSDAVEKCRACDGTGIIWG
jgi:hypothetical protein